MVKNTIMSIVLESITIVFAGIGIIVVCIATGVYLCKVCNSAYTKLRKISKKNTKKSERVYLLSSQVANINNASL